MLMGLKLSLSNTNKYITGTLNKGQLLYRGKGGKRVMAKGEKNGGEGLRARKMGGRKGNGQGWEGRV